MSDEFEFQVYDPDGLGPPTDKLDVLQRVRKILEREDAWCRGLYFRNQHPELDPDDAFCNDWRACLDGMVVMVTIGAARLIAVNGTRKWYQWNVFNDLIGRVFPGAITPTEQRWDLVNEVRHVLIEAINSLFPVGGWGHVEDFNDSHTRTDVIRVVNKAIQTASA